MTCVCLIVPHFFLYIYENKEQQQQQQQIAATNNIPYIKNTTIGALIIGIQYQEAKAKAIQTAKCKTNLATTNYTTVV